MFHWHDGQPHLPNQLRDAAAVLASALDMYEATGEPEYLSTANELADACRTALCDTERGGFWDRRPEPSAPGRLAHPQKLITHNSVLACGLTRLHWLTDSTAHRREAERALRWFASRFQQWGHLSAGYGLAVHVALSDPVLVRIVGRPDHPTTTAMLAAAASYPAACRAVRVLDPEADRGTITQLGLPIHDSPAAYVCSGNTCLPPARSPAELKSALAHR